MKPVIVGITGASGAVMARAAVNALLRRDIPTVALCSNAARLVWQEELGENFNETLVEWQRASPVWWSLCGPADLTSYMAAPTSISTGNTV